MDNMLSEDKGGEVKSTQRTYKYFIEEIILDRDIKD